MLTFFPFISCFSDPSCLVDRWGSGSILVGTDTSGFESLGGKLFIFVGDEVNAAREVVDVGLLTSQIVDTDLGVGNTTVEPGLGVRLN